MKIHYVNGCIVDRFKNDDRISAMFHVVNCQGKMGRGVAKAVRDNIPKVYSEYNKYLKDLGEKAMGRQLTVPFEGRYVVNLFSQFYYSYHSRQLNYGALPSSLIEAKEHLESLGVKEESVLAFPYRMGCNNAGGDWEVVSEMIEFIYSDYRIVYLRGI